MPIRVFLIILFAAAARYFLVLNLPIRILPYEIHEDGIFMRFAANIASGAWLEELDQFTYLKGPGYPFFLAVTNLSESPALRRARIVSDCSDIGCRVGGIPFNEIVVGCGSELRCSRLLSRGYRLAPGVARPDLLGADAAGIFAARDNRICSAAQEPFCNGYDRICRIDLRLDVVHLQ